MKETKPGQQQGQKLGTSQEAEKKIPLSHQMEVKDLVNPITIRRIRILQVGLALIAIAGFMYYYNYYIKAPSGIALTQQWIEAAGGEDAWRGINNGSFERQHLLYADNGEILKEKTERFYFEKTNGQFKLLTNYTTPAGTDLWMGEDKEGHWALLDDLPADPKKSARDLGFMCDSKWCKPDCSMKMTMYRLGMPFHLIGDGVIPTLSGTTEINGQQSNVLNVTYRPTVGKDRWVFYADEETNLINKIEYHHKNDHGHSFPEEMYWSDYRKVGDVTLAHSWKRYWTNGQILEEYRYADFSFNEELPTQFASRPSDKNWSLQ